MPESYPGLVDVRKPQEIADGLLRMIVDDSFEILRQRFASNFTVDHYIANLACALRTIDVEVPRKLGRPIVVGAGLKYQ